MRRTGTAPVLACALAAAVGFGPRFSLGANENSMLGIDVGFTPEGWNLVLHNGQVF